jgi:hypothetical protein
MTTQSPDVFVAAPGDQIQITVNSVGFDQNAKFDPKLNIPSDTQFQKIGQLTMGAAQTIFAIDYNFPDPPPAGAKYTRTVTGPGGFVDGPSDIPALAGQPLLVVPYVLKLSAAGAALGGGRAQ